MTADPSKLDATARVAATLAAERTEISRFPTWNTTAPDTAKFAATAVKPFSACSTAKSPRCAGGSVRASTTANTKDGTSTPTRPSMARNARVSRVDAPTAASDRAGRCPSTGSGGVSSTAGCSLCPSAPSLLPRSVGRRGVREILWKSHGVPPPRSTRPRCTGRGSGPSKTPSPGARRTRYPKGRVIARLAGPSGFPDERGNEPGSEAVPQDPQELPAGAVLRAGLWECRVPGRAAVAAEAPGDLVLLAPQDEALGVLRPGGVMRLGLVRPHEPERVPLVNVEGSVPGPGVPRVPHHPLQATRLPRVAVELGREGSVGDSRAARQRPLVLLCVVPVRTHHDEVSGGPA